jgi:hypothetical protein
VNLDFIDQPPSCRINFVYELLAGLCCLLQQISRATEQPQGQFFDDLLAISADGLGTIEDGIKFQISQPQWNSRTGTCGQMPHSAGLSTNVLGHFEA